MKTEKFATPVAMRIETQEQADEAVSILKELGYSPTSYGDWDARCNRVKTYDTGVFLFLSRNLSDGLAVLKYHPKMLKALAAMRSEGWGVGELVRSNASLALKRGEIVGDSDLPNCVRVRSVLHDKAPFSVNVDRLVKLTAAEIIQHFTPAEKSQEETEQLPEPYRPKVGDSVCHAHNGIGEVRAIQTDTTPMQCLVDFKSERSYWVPATTLAQEQSAASPAPLTYGGDIADFPPEIVEAMLNEQERQGAERDLPTLEKYPIGGFIWESSKEGHAFWNEVIANKDFAHFFARYPKATEQPAQETAESQPAAAKVERHSDEIPGSVKMQIPDSVRDLLRNRLARATSIADNNRATLDKANTDLAAAHAWQKRAEDAYNEARTRRDELQSFIAQFPNAPEPEAAPAKGKRPVPAPRAGSMVMLQYSGQHCFGYGNLDHSKPVEVLFYRECRSIRTDGTEIQAEDKGLFDHLLKRPNCAFKQGDNYCLFAADKNTDYIKEVISY